MSKEIPTTVQGNQFSAEQPLGFNAQKEGTIARRYDTLLRASSELEIAHGKDTQTVCQSNSDALELFAELPFAEKKRKVADLQVLVQTRIESTFVLNLELYDEILTKTNGGATPETAQDRENRRNEFHNKKSSLGNKLILALHIKAQAEELLLEKFDFFVEEWRSYLSSMDASEQEITDEISTLKDKFSKTQKKVGRVGIAKTLKEKVDIVSRTVFHSVLEFYRMQRLEKGMTDSSEDFPSPEILQAQYANSPYREKQKIVDLVHDRIISLLKTEPDISDS